MKKSTWIFLLGFFLLFPSDVNSAGNPAPTRGLVCSRDSSSTNIPTTYTTGAEIATCTISGKQHSKIINKSATDIAVAYSTTANCVGAADNDVVLGTTTAVSDTVGTNTKVCVRSLGSAISSGMVYLVFW